MNPRRTAMPAVEPIGLAEAKAHLRIDHADEDNLITALILAAREAAETHTGLSFISQEWTYALDQWPEDEGFIRSPRGPLLSLSSIKTYDNADTATTWGSGNTFVAIGEDRIYRRAGIAWPVPGRQERGIEISYVAGFGLLASDVPPAIRHALLIMVAHYYSHRGDGGASSVLPLSASALLAPWRARRV